LRARRLFPAFFLFPFFPPFFGLARFEGLAFLGLAFFGLPAMFDALTIYLSSAQVSIRNDEPATKHTWYL
jgi:hypothetical protein